MGKNMKESIRCLKINLIPSSLKNRGILNIIVEWSLLKIIHLSGDLPKEEEMEKKII
jgi:hypothetical protein